jgi:outer membrane lipoprotein carrier protein
MKQYKNLFGVLVFFASFLIIWHSSLATTPTAADELAQLLNNIHTMQATFTQSLINERGTRIGTKTIGKLLLERPGKFRWEITEPNNQLIIINNDKMLSYDPDLSQLTKRKVDYRRPGSPALLLSSAVESLQQLLQIVKLEKQGKEIWFKLTPKAQKNQEIDYQWIKIGFINGKLAAMYIFDNLDQISLISFANIVINTTISSKKFTFIPPPNTEIFNSI